MAAVRGELANAGLPSADLEPLQVLSASSGGVLEGKKLSVTGGEPESTNQHTAALSTDDKSEPSSPPVACCLLS